MQKKILKLLSRKDYVPANVPELLQGLKLPPNEQQNLQEDLRVLEKRGDIARIKGNRWILPDEAGLIPGRIQITRGGRGFLSPDDPALREISIPSAGTGTALHEDHVLVRRDLRPKGKGKGDGAKDVGSVVRVLERRRTQFVGTLKKSKRFLYVIPDDPRMPHDFYVPEPRDLGRPARPGDKVVVELREWESRHTNPEGEITEVLGPPNQEGVDMLSVLRQYELPLKFPRAVLREAQRFGKKVNPADLEGRKDWRKHDVITIDPIDAKDFDDAFYLERSKGKGWKLWVHIADVSHYVKPGTALDEEARRRGNSTYLVDRVIPMLPEALSNELCSLKPKVDRLTKCVEFDIGDDGRVHGTRVYPSVIHSKRRFSYEDAFKVLKSDGKGADRIETMLRDAGQLAERIRKRRFKAGSLELEFTERKIRLDDKGRIRAIDKVENDLSHQMIEEFMLLANEAVATKLIRANKATIHRVHEKPDPVRLKDYRDDVLSHNIPCGNLEKPAEVKKLLKRLDDVPIGAALKIGFLRSLMRARYAVQSLGHYGLAMDEYAHFTSPIRRYADLVVHRTLFEKGKISRQAMKQTADHLSVTERNSADAERDSRDVKLMSFLLAQLKSGEPERYQSLVTDVRGHGFFVDVLDLGMSGFVPLSIHEDDFYVFDQQRARIRGRRNGRVIKLGDELEVEIASVDTFKKQADFRMTPVQGGGKKKRKPRGSAGEGQKRNRKRRRSRGSRGAKKQGRGDKRRG